MLKDTVLFIQKTFLLTFSRGQSKESVEQQRELPKELPVFSIFLSFVLSFFFYCVAQLHFEASFDRPFFPSIGALKNPIVEQKLIIKSYTTYIRCTVKDTVHAGEIRVSLWLQVAHNSQATGSAVCRH